MQPQQLRPDQRAVLAELLQIDAASPDFWPLVEITLDTLRQVTAGKGRDRHARGRDYVDQPINVIPTLLGELGLGFLIGQAMRKAEESVTMSHDRKVAELRGAAVYLLTAILWLERRNAVMLAAATRAE